MFDSMILLDHPYPFEGIALPSFANLSWKVWSSNSWQQCGWLLNRKKA
jgi:hypothetical protein